MKTDQVYMFDLLMICGGYVYFQVFTQYDGLSDQNREFRVPSLVSLERSIKASELLGQEPILIDSDKKFMNWLHLKGWALIEKDYVQRTMGQFLSRKECLQSPFGQFTDIELVSPGTLKRTYYGNKKRKILERDSNKCLVCDSGDCLTMQHVVPHSKGGETTSRNLVTLCEKCNAELESRFEPELFKLAGLRHSYDASIIKTKWISDEHRYKAIEVCSNLMQTRCELW